MNLSHMYMLFGMDDKALQENGLVLTKGRMPENDKELVISRHIEYNGRVYWNVGDTITLDIGTRQDSTGYVLEQHNPYQAETGANGLNGDNDDMQVTYKEFAEEIVNTQKKQYKIVGIIERPNTNLEEYSAPGYTVITHMTDEEIAASSSNDSYGTNISVLFNKPTEAKQTIKDILKTLEDNTGKDFNVARNYSLLEAQGGLSEESLKIVYTLRSYNNRNNSSK